MKSEKARKYKPCKGIYRDQVRIRPPVKKPPAKGK